MKFNRIQPDLPRKTDPRLGTKLRLLQPITNPSTMPPNQGQMELLEGIDEELLDYTTEAVRRLMEKDQMQEVLERNGLVVLNHQLDALPRTPYLIPALMETTGSYGPYARAGVFVNCHPEEEGTYAFFPGTGGSHDPALSINGKTLLLGEMDIDLKRKKKLPKNDFIREERRCITTGQGWVMPCDEYTAEDAAQTVFSFRQAQVQKRLALEAFLKKL